MAPIFLVLMIFGIAARTCAWPYAGEYPGDDEDGYEVGTPLSELCHQAFYENEAKYDVTFVNSMLENICPLLLDDGGEGSGEGSGEVPKGLQPQGLNELTLENIVQSLSRDPAIQQTIRNIAESICLAGDQGHMGIESFCRFRLEGIKLSSGGGGGGGGGSGSGSGDGDNGDFGNDYSSYSYDELSWGFGDSSDYWW